MPLDPAVSDPFRRKLLTQFAQNNGGQLPTQPDANVAEEDQLPQELDVNQFTNTIRGEAQAIRNQGYQEVAASQKKRGILQSGETARLDQTVAENARLTAESRLAESTLNLLNIRHQERMQKLQSLTSLAGQEIQGGQQIGAIRATGEETRQTQSAQLASSERIATQQMSLQEKTYFAGLGSQEKIAFGQMSSEERRQVMAGEQTIAQITAQGAETRLTIGVQSSATIAEIGAQSVANLASIAAQGGEARKTLTQQGAQELASIAAQAIEGRLTLDQQSLNTLKQIQEQAAQGRITLTQEQKGQMDQLIRQINSAEGIASLQSTTQIRLEQMSLTSAEKQQLEGLKFSREQLSEQQQARIKQNEIDIGNMIGEVRDPRTGLTTLTLAQRAQTESISQFDQTLATQVSEGNLSRQSAEKVAKWNVIQQAQGFDITTDTGRADMEKFTKDNHLTAQDQKDIVKWQVAAGASGYDLSTDTGRAAFQTFVTTQASKYQLSAADQKSIAIAGIAQNSAGYDLTDPNQRNSYYYYVQANASKYNLTVEDQKTLTMNKLNEDARQFNLTNATEWDKFITSLDATTKQFNLTQENQMAVVRAQIESNEYIAKGGYNVKLLEDSLDLLSNPIGSQAFLDADLKGIVNKFLNTQWAKDPITGTNVPKSAAISVNGTSPASRAKQVSVGALQDVGKSREVYSNFQKSYGSMKGQGKYNESMDFDQNGVIDMDDMFILQPFLRLE